MRTSDLARWEQVGHRPVIEEDEEQLYLAHSGTLPKMVVGVIITFVPPFVFGPLMIFIVQYFARHSGVIVTDHRIIAFRKSIRPGNYTCLDIPLDSILKVKVGSLMKGIYVDVNIFERFLGVGDGNIKFKTESGVRHATLNAIKAPKALVAALNEARRGVAG